MELPYIEYAQTEPGIKLVHERRGLLVLPHAPPEGLRRGARRSTSPMLEAEGHKPLLARFGTRIYIYATGVTPIGAGKAPGVS